MANSKCIAHWGGGGENVQDGKLPAIAKDGTPPRHGKHCYIIIVHVSL